MIQFLSWYWKRTSSCFSTQAKADGGEEEMACCWQSGRAAVELEQRKPSQTGLTEPLCDSQSSCASFPQLRQTCGRQQWAAIAVVG